jgi:shikimate kinase
MKRIFLVGFMGCGKSTVGRNLARALNWQFVDLDTYIQGQQGCSITEIFDRLGETGFRLLEQEALKAVSQLNEVVVATGGGAPCFHNNMAIMKQAGLTIYLQLSPQGLYERLLPARRSRPLIADKSETELFHFIEVKLAEREPFYKQASVVADAAATGVESYLKIIQQIKQL